jgi:hypothetical protein
MSLLVPVEEPLVSVLGVLTGKLVTATGSLEITDCAKANGATLIIGFVRPKSFTATELTALRYAPPSGGPFWVLVSASA